MAIVKKVAAKKAVSPKGGANAASDLVQNITNKYRVTAREARDIVTAISNAASTGYANMGKNTSSGPQTGRMLKDIAKQTGEFGKAVVTGKKGTTPLSVSDNPKDVFYGAWSGNKFTAKKVAPGKKRK